MCMLAVEPVLYLLEGNGKAAERHGVMQGNEHFKQVQQQVSSGLKQGMKRLRNKMSSLQQQMGSTEESQHIQKQADLLTANLYRFHHIRAAASCSGCLPPLFS